MESVIKANKIKIEKINENDYNRIFVKCWIKLT